MTFSTVKVPSNYESKSGDETFCGIPISRTLPGVY